jgi:uncharacterized protein YjiK
LILVGNINLQTKTRVYLIYKLVTRREVVMHKSAYFCLIICSLCCLACGLSKKTRATRSSIELASYVSKGKSSRVPGVFKNASGLTYSAHSKTLFCITNSGTLVEFTRKGKLKRTIRLRGFKDPEGVAHVEGNTFAIIEENRGTISFVTLDAKTKLAKRDPSTELKVDTVGGNKGLEGLTYDSLSKTFFVVKEKSPRKVYKVTRNGKVSMPWNAESSALGLRDLSGIFFDPVSQHLILLSHKSKVAVECTTGGREIARLPLNLRQAEGVTIDDEGNLYICGEPNFLLVFEKKK